MDLQANVTYQEQQSMGFALADTKSYCEVNSSQFWRKNQDITNWWLTIRKKVSTMNPFREVGG